MNRSYPLSRLAHRGGGRTHRVLVVDGSFSMAYRPAEESRFDRAKQLARRIVEESRQGDAFTLVLMAAPPKVVIGTPALAQDEVLDEIENLERVDTSIDLPAAGVEIVSMAPPPERGGGQKFEGEAEEVVPKVVTLLKTEAKVL